MNTRPVISDAARAHLLWSLTDGVGPIIFGRLGMHFGNPAAALGAAGRELEAVHGIGRATADKVARSRDEASSKAELEIETAAAHGVRILCREDEEYPAALRPMPDPPIVLYIKGELRATDAVALAIVGTRKCSIYGGEQARRFSELLAGAGFTIVSGLARGIDAFAHHGAVESGGRSIAVLGNGLTEVYPPENRTLAEKLTERGALLSELPLRTSVQRENFHGRNRIIAGLCLGTLIVEAPQRSGALITARFATEYNREVFAVPGRLQDPNCIGSNALIRDGAAKLVTCLEDVVVELGEVGLAMMQDRAEQDEAAPAPGPGDSASATGRPAEEGRAPMPAGAHSEAAPQFEEAHRPQRPALALNPIEQRVFALVGYDPILQDSVLAAAGFAPGEVLAAFTALELKGLVRRLPGQLVVRGGKA